MSTYPVRYADNAASAAEIAEHLARCDSRFVPRLSARVDIAAYAAKIAARATRFEAWSGDELIGLVAAYCNDGARGAAVRAAFITSVSVLEAWAGAGIAAALVRRSCEYAKLQSLGQVRLEVAAGNAGAIRLYERCGFAVAERSPDWLTMTIDLTADERCEAQDRYARLRR
jgi:ribosomal protein S18 acetylase RimI-like enzyme